MDKITFSKIMESFRQRYEAVEAKRVQVYDLLGLDMAELLEQTSYEKLLYDVIAMNIAEYGAYTADEVLEDLFYLICDCNFDLATYCENTTITVDGEGKHPILTTWEDYFDYLTRKD